MNMNPNDFMGYSQGQQPQQPMQMPNFNPSMPMQPNFGKGLPNFNPQNMQMNRQNTMNQYQAMQFPGMPNPMNQMQPSAMANPMTPGMNQNMMKQHNMMPPTGASFGFSAPNNRHRSSLTGMQFNNTTMFPQMIPTQSGTQPPTITLQSQSSNQPKKKRPSSQANNNTNNPLNVSTNSNGTSANSSQSIPLQPSSSIENLSGSINSNANISTPISDTSSEKVGNSGARGSKSQSGSSSQKHASMMSNQSSMNNMSGIGSISSMNNLTQMNSMNNLNMGMSGMSSIGNMNNLGQMGSLSSMNSMNNMASMNMNMNMNMGMNMGMPMSGMNMNGMNVMNGMNMMNSMNPMGLNGMSSMGNLSGMNSMGGSLSGINSMNSMSGMGNLPNMPSMPGMTSSSTNPAVASQSSTASTSNSSSLQQAVVPQSSTSTQQSNQSNPPQTQPQVPNQVSNQSNQPQNQQRTQQQTINVPPQIQNQTAVQQMPLMITPGGISPEITRMKNLLEKMSKEKADLFFALFEVQGKKRHDKIKYFINYVINFHPNWVLFTINFLDQINQSPSTTTPASSSTVNNNSNPSLSQQNSSAAPPSVPQPPNAALNVNTGLNIYQKFKEPPLSPIFSRVKNFKPMFKNLVLNQNCLSFSPENCKKYIVIGSFLSSAERIDPEKDSVSVLCDNTEIIPLNFGGNESYYVLFPEGEKVPPLFQVRVTSQSKAFPPSFLTWFVCQVVEKRNAYEILDSLLTAVLPPTVQKEKIQIARTPMCKGCNFYAIHVIEDILNKGFAFCPTCHANIVLNDLIFDTKVTGTPQQINFKIEENKDMKQGRNACADTLTSLMKPSRTEQDWEYNIFDKPGLDKKEYVPLEFTDTDEFRNDISQFSAHSFT